ncbi:AsmA family protein [Minwuia sp.]|uniref:AsmA family protein n=1 Tax=Minwuia sp. TaxID=2493630 RepID=UPI003A911DE0
MRILLIGVCTVAVLVVAGLFAAPLLIDASDYRDRIEAAASRVIGQPVQINGEMSFRLLPTPRLVADDMVVSAPSDAAGLPPLLVADHLELGLSLGRLLGGTLLVNRATLEKPVVRLQTDLAGRRNWVRPGGARAVVRMLTISDGRLGFSDARTGRSADVYEIAGSIRADEATGALRSELTGLWQRRRADLDFRMSAGNRPAVSVDINVEQLGNLAFQGRLADGADLPATGEMKLAVDDLAALGEHSLLAARLPRPLSATLQGQATVNADAIALEAVDGTIETTAFGGRLTVVAGTIFDIDAAIAFDQVDGMALKPWLAGLFTELAGRQPDADAGWPVRTRLRLDAGLVSFPDGFIRQFSLDSVYDRGLLTVDHLTAQASGGSAFSFVGEMRLSGGAFRIGGQADLSSDNLAALLLSGGVPVESGGQGRLRNLAATSRISVSSDVAQISALDLTVDQSRIRGGLAIALVKRPSFSTNLTLDQINANAYVRLLVPGGDVRSLLSGPDGAPDLSFLNGFDTNSTIRIERLIAGSSVARDVFMDFGLIGGALDLKTLNVRDLDGAALTLSGQLDTPENPQMLFRATVQADQPEGLFGGSANEVFRMLGRTSDLAINLGIEGSLSRTALDADIRSAEISGQVSGLLSALLGDPRFDLDVSLSSREASLLRDVAVPGFHPPFALSGPAVTAATLKGSAGSFTLDGRIDVMQARLEANGSISDLDKGRPDYDFDLLFRHGDVSELVRSFWPDRQFPPDLPTPVQMTARLNGNAERSMLTDLIVENGDDRMSGELTVDWRQRRPAVTARLSGLVLDADRFVPAGTSGAARVAQTGDRSERWSRQPLENPGPEGFSLSADVAFESLTVEGLTLTEGRFDLSTGAAGGAVKKLQANLGGGDVSGEILLETTGFPALQTSLKLRGGDLKSWLGPLLGVESGITGTLDLDIDATGQGVTAFDLVRNLQGQIRIGDGELAWDSSAGLAKPPISEVSGQIPLRRGVIRLSPPLQAEASDDSAVRILGEIDLPGWQAEMEVRFAGDEMIRLRGSLHDLQADVVR